MRKSCRMCGVPVVPTERELRKGDYLCPDHRREEKRYYQNQWTARRRAAGRPIAYETTEGRRKRDKEYASRSEVKAMKAAAMRRYVRDPRLRARHEARWRVQRAVKAGVLKRGPCFVCGLTLNIQGHHEDYSKPLDVIWLCTAHHRAQHDAALEGKK